MYRPLSNMMASRFTSAITPDIEAAPTSVVEEPIPFIGPALQTTRTRTTTEWRPDRLLCKRFNVPNPFPEAQSELEEAKRKQEDEKEVLNERTMEELKRERDRQQYEQTETPGLETAHNEEMGIEEEEEEEEEEVVKPAMDIFKAIFDDSDDEEDEDMEVRLDPCSYQNRNPFHLNRPQIVPKVRLKRLYHLNPLDRSFDPSFVKKKTAKRNFRYRMDL